MDDAHKPVFEKIFGAKKNRFVVVYPRDNGYNLWVYAYDQTPVKSPAGSGQPPGPKGVGRCLALRTWLLRGNGLGKDIYEMLYEIGDLDPDTQAALLSLVKTQLIS